MIVDMLLEDPQITRAADVFRFLQHLIDQAGVQDLRRQADGG
jgi:hypothetical protein